MKVGKAKIYPEPQALGNHQPRPSGWPKPLSKTAMQGLIGEIVRTVSPHTEADPAALLLQTIVALGAVIGRSPHFMVGATRHGTNLFAVIAGQTARGRKGSSWDFIASLLRRIDPHWAEKRIQSGLSTGEGLVALAANGQSSKGSGIDNRILFVEDELSSVLRVMTRPTSTLSTTLRRAWDAGTLQVSTRQSPLLVSEPHVSLIGHITLPDLARYMSHSDVFGGLFNRFLWDCVERSKFLPYGGCLPKREFDRIVNRTHAAVDFASRVGAVELSNKSRNLWKREYLRITNATASTALVDAVTARGKAQTRRLAMIYAILDLSEIVKTQHLHAGLELWRYCQSSAEFIFNRTKRVGVQDKIFQVLPTSGPGLSRTDISHALHGHCTSEESHKALANLRTLDLAKSKQVSTGGRTAEKWVKLESGGN